MQISAWLIISLLIQLHRLFISTEYTNFVKGYSDYIIHYTSDHNITCMHTVRTHFKHKKDFKGRAVHASIKAYNKQSDN